MRKKSFALVLAVVLCVIFCGCAKEDHWGQELKIDKKWWKKEGHSWDRKDKIFMAIGYSNPDWKDKFDARKSADLNARSEVASFMQTLVKNYMQELRNSNYAISESIVESSSEETLLGAVIVARHYDKGKKQYQSLIKIDMKYFFDQIYDKYKEENAMRIRAKNKKLSSEELDEKIKASTDEGLASLKEMENPVVEKAIEEGGAK
jgi:hypothetical protein